MSTIQPIAGTTSSRIALLEAVRVGLDDWRTRLRVTVYELYRHLGQDQNRHLLVGLRAGGERTTLLVETEIAALVELIDAGRAEPTAPSLTRATAESLGGAIFWQLSLAAGREAPPSPEAELVPGLMYVAVLPYVGPVAAAEELRIPPPSR